MRDHNTIGRRNAAIEAGRLFSGNMAGAERCHACGELLHPYPKPKFWMQYPLPECCVLDGLKFCDDHRKPECIDAYLVERPTLGRPMAKKRKSPARSGQDWSAPAAELLAELPGGRDELLAAAVAAVVEVDAAIRRGDGAAAEAASDKYEAIIWKMNGGTHVGSMANHDTAGQVIKRHCAAVPGDVPLWGQRGQFLVTIGDMRALVEYEAGYGGPLGAHFQFHVIDLDRPFISETGYRSHFDTAHGCMMVDEVARGILAAMLTEKKRPVMVEASYRDRLANAPLPAWLAGLEPPARREPATVPIPPGFVMVDVVLPEHKAFIARKWAAEAKAKIKAAEAAELYTKEDKS